MRASQFKLSYPVCTPDINKLNFSRSSRNLRTTPSQCCWESTALPSTPAPSRGWVPPCSNYHIQCALLILMNLTFPGAAEVSHNTKSVLLRIYSFAQHPSSFKRMGGSLFKLSYPVCTPDINKLNFSRSSRNHRTTPSQCCWESTALPSTPAPSRGWGPPWPSTTSTGSSGRRRLSSACSPSKSSPTLSTVSPWHIKMTSL